VTTVKATRPERRRVHKRAPLRELVLHLAHREVVSSHRFTVLGWAWPLTKQLAQLAVLVFVFGSVLDLGIRNFPVFVFSGLVAWGWFSSGLSSATSSLLTQRHLVFQPRFPIIVLPVVAVVVPLVDVGVALPVLLVMLAAAGGVPLTVLFVPVLLLVQGVLMCGIAWLTASATVYLRDVRDIVGIGLTLLFYLTPVFYDRGASVPVQYHWLFQLNPLTTIVEGWRAVLLEGRLPAAGPLLVVAGVGAAAAVAGALFFRRLEHGLVDEL
jgi:lipopolysaccharide transport system permease protein